MFRMVYASNACFSRHPNCREMRGWRGKNYTPVPYDRISLELLYSLFVSALLRDKQCHRTDAASRASSFSSAKLQPLRRMNLNKGLTTGYSGFVSLRHWWVVFCKPCDCLRKLKLFPSKVLGPYSDLFGGGGVWECFAASSRVPQRAATLAGNCCTRYR